MQEKEETKLRSENETESWRLGIGRKAAAGLFMHLKLETAAISRKSELRTDKKRFVEGKTSWPGHATRQAAALKLRREGSGEGGRGGCAVTGCAVGLGFREEQPER